MDPYPIPVRTISIFVTLLHALLLGALLWVAPSYEAKTKPKQLVVQTIQLTPKGISPPQTSLTTKMETKTATPSKPKNSPSPPKKEPVKQPSKKDVKPTPKQETKPAPAPPKKTPPKTPSQVPAKSPPKQAETPSTPPAKKGPSQESLAAVRQKLASIPSSAIVMGPTVSSETSSGTASLSYEEELAARLKILLKLPEMGDVRVALTLNRQGVVTKLEIISSASALNKKAVETHLPPIQFPPFGKAYPGETTHTITLTLTNL